MTASYKIAIYPQNVATIRFSGTVDGSLVQKGIEECLNRQCFSVVVDMADVVHANSNALGTFINLKTTFDQRSGRMVFVQPSGPVAIVFDMMGFREVFRYYADINTALRELIQMPSNTRRISM